MPAKLMHDVSYDDTVSIKVGSLYAGESYSAVYKLYATVVHSGATVDSGHYYTYGQDTDDIWYKMDDTSVTSCSIRELRKLKTGDTPYLLFYRMDCCQNDREELIGFNRTITPTPQTDNDNVEPTNIEPSELVMEIGTVNLGLSEVIDSNSYPKPPPTLTIELNDQLPTKEQIGAEKIHIISIKELPTIGQIGAENIHVISKGHVCSVCGGNFASASKLKTHRTSHSNEKPFGCMAPNCGKKYKLKSNLTQHIRHTHARHLLKL